MSAGDAVTLTFADGARQAQITDGAAASPNAKRRLKSRRASLWKKPGPPPEQGSLF
jgi:hypothetical protein